MSGDPTVAPTHCELRRDGAGFAIFESSGGRVMRYAHNVARVLGVPAQAVALLTVIMLRGPQTIGELRMLQADFGFRTGFNPKHHCTNSIRGRYSRKLSKLNNTSRTTE